MIAQQITALTEIVPGKLLIIDYVDCFPFVIVMVILRVMKSQMSCIYFVGFS